VHAVDEQTRAALAKTEMTADQVRITERLDPVLWQAVATVLARMGGRYQTSRSAFGFGFDPRPAVRELIASGKCRTVAQTEGFVATSGDLAEELTTRPYSDLERMPRGSRVLEPSAGYGAIAAAVLEANDEIEVVAVEPNTDRAAMLHALGERVKVVAATFEEYAAGRGNGELFDAVVMNPPFAVPGKPTLWIDHVMLAWNMLEPGGRLVAVVPNGLTFRGDRQHRDIRQLAEDFGGWLKLPNDTFPNGLSTCVLWLARPVPGQDGRPPYLFRHYPEAIQPVRVTYPWLAARAVQEAPVQVWTDRAWDGRDRVLRYRAQCWRCGWLLWEFDETNDQALGNHATHNSLYAEEDGAVGLALGLCPTCGDDRKTCEAAIEVARDIWRRPPTKAAPVSVWSMLLNQGGMIPVGDLERERHARVQAALRLAFGVGEHAPEDKLIEARQAKPWRDGPDRLAAKYLQAYADRLDPDADLDDADRAALLWRGHPDAPAITLAVEPDPWGPVLHQLEQELGLIAR